MHLNTKYKKTLLTKVVAMGLRGKLLQIIVHGVIIFAIVAAATAATIAKPGCPSNCGGVDIPYPFGLSKDCYQDSSFSITCQSGKPMTGNLTVTGISIETHELQVLNWVVQDCYQQNGIRDCLSSRWLQSPVFYISNSKNKFIVLGCDTIGYLNGTQNGERYWTGCSSKCFSLTNVVNGSCSGVGCCELARFPDGLQNISVEAYSNENHAQVLNFNPCGYAFVVEKGKFNFSTSYLKNISNEMVPLVLDWAVGNQTCEKAQNEQNFACKNNSDCRDHPKSRRGYQCKCKEGYNGNPYLDGGCQDINECLDPTQNNCMINCSNTEGNYTCRCPKWYDGDGSKDGEGCSADLALWSKISIGIGTSLIVLLGGSSGLYCVLQKRISIKLKVKLFQGNGGLILQQHLRELGSTKKAKIFTFEELKKATNNFKESRIIGRGGFGTVYKGFLQDNTIVAIKKSKIVDEVQVGQFLKEIVLLSQIDHKNVVKLLGRCLETQVPLLVYEFVPKGTLFNYIHNESSASTKHWEICLRIAVEIADALSYLHSIASPPIIHRDVKPSNILLDDNFTAKVSDFGISKLVPGDKKELAAVVQGTFGYLDLNTYRRTS